MSVPLIFYQGDHVTMIVRKRLARIVSQATLLVILGSQPRFADPMIFAKQYAHMVPPCHPFTTSIALDSNLFRSQSFRTCLLLPLFLPHFLRDRSNSSHLVPVTEKLNTEVETLITCTLVSSVFLWPMFSCQSQLQQRCDRGRTQPLGSWVFVIVVLIHSREL